MNLAEPASFKVWSAARKFAIFSFFLNCLSFGVLGLDLQQLSDIDSLSRLGPLPVHLLLILAVLLRYRRRSLIIEAFYAVTQRGVAHKPLAVTDAIIFLAVVSLAVAPPANVLLQ